jgi:hypothetical protein
MLSDLVLPAKSNLIQSYSGIDSLEKCPNRDHFLNYPYKIQYQYNSRGFRDAEWPNDFNNTVWCVGDSFTVGIGSPYQNTWSYLLQQQLEQRCINISMDGASNTWISRRACQIINEVQPTLVVVLWSYLHRRELPNRGLTDEQRIIHSDKFSSESDDLENFIQCLTNVKNCAGKTTVIHGAIPNCCSINQQAAWNHLCQQHHIIQLENLDYARDCHHFDRITSEHFVRQIYNAINSVSQECQN